MGSGLDEQGYNLYRAMRVLAPGSAYASLSEVERLPLNRMYQYVKYELQLRNDSAKQREHKEANK